MVTHHAHDAFFHIKSSKNNFLVLVICCCKKSPNSGSNNLINEHLLREYEGGDCRENVLRRKSTLERHQAPNKRIKIASKDRDNDKKRTRREKSAQCRK